MLRPSNMHIPRGSLDGLVCQLFVMISDYAEDVIDDEGTENCNDAPAYCGVRDARYPDKKAMGFPFDRRSRAITNKRVTSLDDFVTTNMKIQNVSIRFNKNKTKCPEDSVLVSSNGSDTDE